MNFKVKKWFMKINILWTFSELNSSLDQNMYFVYINNLEKVSHEIIMSELMNVSFENKLNPLDIKYF
jgi:hypothetical protein